MWQRNVVESFPCGQKADKVQSVIGGSFFFFFLSSIWRFLRLVGMRVLLEKVMLFKGLSPSTWMLFVVGFDAASFRDTRVFFVIKQAIAHRACQYVGAFFFRQEYGRLRARELRRHIRESTSTVIGVRTRLSSGVLRSRYTLMHYTRTYFCSPMDPNSPFCSI